MAAPTAEYMEDLKDIVTGICAADGVDPTISLNAWEAAFPSTPNQDGIARRAAVRARIARIVGHDVRVYSMLNDKIHSFINREAARVLSEEQYAQTASVRGGLRRTEKITAPGLRPLRVPDAIINMFNRSIARQNEVAKHYEEEYARCPTEALKEENERHAYYRATFLKMRDRLVQGRAQVVN